MSLSVQCPSCAVREIKEYHRDCAHIAGVETLWPILFHSQEDAAPLTMDWWGIACWGLFGGFAVEGLEFWSMVRKNKGVLPVQYSLPYLCGQAARILIGAGLAVAFWESGAVTSVIGAVGIGAAAPAIVKKLME